MLAFPAMLIEAAKKAGISVPEDPDNFDKDEYPYFNVFCTAQLCKSTRYPGEHWSNAEIIAKIPKTKIRKITLSQLILRGFSY